MIELRDLSVPGALLREIESRESGLTYTSPKTIYYCVDCDYRGILVGVFGDGNNGSYEWFIWDGAELKTSDCGIGTPGGALCRGLVEAGAQATIKNRDVVLAWKRRAW